MTKPLSKEEKKQRRLARKQARKQQKAALTTVQAVAQPKPTETPSPPVNLCDDCAYEFGECEGVPKFAQVEGADDRVVECPAFVNVGSMPTADQGKKEAAAEASLPDIVLVCSGGCGKTTEGMTSETKSGEFKQVDESDAVILDEHRREVPEWTCQECLDKRAEPPQEAEGAAEERAVMEADIEASRKKTQRFYQKEDLGTCQSCSQPLKRTALNRDRDAVRCVNGHCRQYRFIIKTIPTGV